jgi:hypothetical protein
MDSYLLVVSGVNPRRGRPKRIRRGYAVTRKTKCPLTEDIPSTVQAKGLVLVTILLYIES